MGIHKEGFRWLLWSLGLFSILTVIGFWVHQMAGLLVFILCMIVYLLLLWFFRDPHRTILQPDPSTIYAPCDGRVVVIEEVLEDEYFKEKRIQISIFMSPLNVHINWNPINGEILYVKHHPGKYLVAWHPKSSSENEMTSTVLKSEKTSILVKQIAGAVARRIINYMKAGLQVKAGSEMGFIKFGSRVDLLLPFDADIKVNLQQIVKGTETIIAKI
jgi:phosphatidylserine decarboxylase